MDSKIIFNLSLIPEPEFSARLMDYSQKLQSILNGEYFLGPESLPHVTLLQFEAAENKAKDLWRLVEHLSEKVSHLDYRGLSIEKWGDLDCLWLRVARKSELMRLQDKAIKLLPPQMKFLNGIGEEYEPHSTLAAWKALSYLPTIPLDPALFGASRVGVQLTLGKSGPTYQFARKLFLERT